MDKITYNKVYKSLNSIEDVTPLSHYFKINKGVIYSIFSQKIVNNVKFNYGILKKNSPIILDQWNKGTSIIEIANEKKTPPTLIASLILKELNLSKKVIFNNPEKIIDDRLRLEILEAWRFDNLFSPFAHKIQLKRGKLGEEIIDLWLKKLGIEFLSEQQLRIQNMLKTPDFLFNEPLIIDDQEIYWIESKAMFGTEHEHNYYTKKQFTYYEQMGGNGLVVYWYGYIDTILDKQYIIKDYTFFSQYKEKIIELMNLGVPL